MKLKLALRYLTKLSVTFIGFYLGTLVLFDAFYLLLKHFYGFNLTSFSPFPSPTVLCILGVIFGAQLFGQGFTVFSQFNLTRQTQALSLLLTILYVSLIIIALSYLNHAFLVMPPTTALDLTQVLPFTSNAGINFVLTQISHWLLLIIYFLCGSLVRLILQSHSLKYLLMVILAVVITLTSSLSAVIFVQQWLSIETTIFTPSNGLLFYLFVFVVLLLTNWQLFKRAPALAKSSY